MSTSQIAQKPLGAAAQGGRKAALALRRWLGLVAAPTFAIMALWTAFFSAAPDMICMATRSASAMSGMTLMYLLMGAFHLSPWLKLLASRCSSRSTAGMRPGKLRAP
ncbi:MAG TPA: hypothetical protein VMA54_18955 [Steroidobacteraceae bacterium]|nr:hypothetical protein [Steroidobacteraceae bacterium]